MLSLVRDAGEGMRVARLRAVAPRYVVAAVLALLVVLGVRSVVWPPQPPRAAVPTTADTPSRNFALQFARAYLTYDANRPAARQHALAPFLPSGLDGGAGVFVDSGRQRVLWTELASDQPALVGGRVITVAAGVSTQSTPVYLAVPVRHPHNGGVSLTGFPSFVGAPSLEPAAAVPSHEEVSDSAVKEVAARVLRNYLAGSAENLRADLTPDAVVTLPTVQLRLEHLDQLAWLGSPGSGAVLATVTARDAQKVNYTLTYELGIAYSERPYVTFIEVIPSGS